MITFYNKTCKKLEETIKEIEFESDFSLQQIEDIINAIMNSLEEIKRSVFENGFKNIKEEIWFFKEYKPKIFSKLIYYNSIYRIEAKKPYGGKEVLNSYINNELLELKRFFDKNIEFYSYYRTQSTYLDHLLFVRDQKDIKLGLDISTFEADPRFSTSHDFKVANLIANDLIHVYLEKQINENNRRRPPENFTLNWTDSKTALIELIYSLHVKGVFDNGNADLKIIAKVFENTFNVDLGDFYHTFMELKSRKLNRTKFLDSLREALIRKMDDQDE